MECRYCVEEVREDPLTSTMVFCSCTGGKTNMYVRKKLDQVYTPGKCKCKPSNVACKRKSQQWTYVLGEVNSSDLITL